MVVANLKTLQQTSFEVVNMRNREIMEFDGKNTVDGYIQIYKQRETKDIVYDRF